MILRNIKIGLLAIFVSMGFYSCEKDLGEFDSSSYTSEKVYENPENYIGVLAKCYAGLAVGGQTDGDGSQDIGGIDGGMSNYLRQYFQLQELPTDEAIIAWGEANLPDLHNMTWGADNQFTTAMYYRVMYQVTLANEFIRETSDSRLNSRGFSVTDIEKIKGYRAEARFLRALSYYHALDLFGNMPFVDENFKIGASQPSLIKRAELFKFVEKELLEIKGKLKEPRTNEYGRADRAAAWMLLAKLYLNAEVYIGEQRYKEAVEYSDKVNNAGYSLNPKYENLFLSDNNIDNNEVIFPINFNGTSTRTWGGTTYIIHAGVGGSMKASEYGINGGWYGLRTTKSLVEKFPNTNGTKDVRGRFYTDGQTLEINNVSNFSEGYPLIKFKNITSTGRAGSDATGNFVDTDFPLFRLADSYLMYAEAVLRGGGGDKAKALDLVNKIRERAYRSKDGNIRESELTLDFILDERARELAWEAMRRTDLIRYNKFTTGQYVWPWKGGVKEGKGVEEFKNLYPIPSKDLIVNTNLIQNKGY
ncbi:RagB/SusD family nutrient uptake outer membrane protein [Ornithobacterium rhinotracheale]|uniref:RagB/SusD family nutrient uptake outer membrane protein n=1 Tax=Ornithobacterium rhinotracheale TaxID=28251 RepID=UPI001FF2663E|nr:RagB/SusD family nutrient uptake outer membrane protein [Ornithobacterium rhinotracheale]MCK0203091.1 RagB/SusD family nutrient uptake outer membrane protein [Ornithobacterium rhinotracheale]